MKKTREDFEEEIDLLFRIQIILTILFLFTTFLSLLILYDAYLKSKEEEGLFKEEEVQTIIRIVRTASFLITLGFLFNTYEGVEVAQVLDQYNRNLQIQLVSSVIAVIPALLALYVAFSGSDELVQTFNPEV